MTKKDATRTKCIWVRMEPELHARIHAVACDTDRTVSNLIHTMLKKKFGGER